MNDADIEMAELEEAGNLIHHLKGQGICVHSSTVGPMLAEQFGMRVPVGSAVMCWDCGKGFVSVEAAHEEYADIIGEWL